MAAAGSRDLRWMACGESQLPPTSEWLSPGEAEVAAGARTAKRRREYLLRRWTCKQAVAVACGLPTDLRSLSRIDVANRPSGAPDVRLDGAPLESSISLSDRAGWAICFLSGPTPVGCDVELVEPRSAAFVADFLTDAERAFVASRRVSDRDEAVNLVWSAKESALKVLLTGLRRDTRSVEVRVASSGGDADAGFGSGWSALQVRTAEGREFPGWWRRDGEFVVTAVTEEPQDPPRALAGSGDLATARPSRSRPERPGTRWASMYSAYDSVHDGLRSGHEVSCVRRELVSGGAEKNRAAGQDTPFDTGRLGLFLRGPDCETLVRLGDANASSRRGSVTKVDANEGLSVGPHAIFGVDTEGICTHSTGPALAHLGLRPGELVGADLFELYRHDPINVAALRRVLSGESFSLEREFAGRLLSTYFEPVRGADGTVSGGLGVTTDITEQRRLEGLLRDARERAGLLADVSEALSRDLLDPDVLLRTIVRSVTEKFADVGVVWVRGLEDQYLAPGACWRSELGSEQIPGNGLPLDEGWPERLDVSAVEAGSGVRPLGVKASETTGMRSSHLSRTGDTGGNLRVPLRSRDLLVGAIDIVRGPARGGLAQEEIDLVVEVSQRCALALDHALLLRSEQESREALVKFKALADASEDVIAISDDAGEIVYVNPRVVAYGIDLSGNDAFASAAASMGERWSDDVRRALETAGRWSGDLTFAQDDREAVGHLDVFRIFHPANQASLGAAWIARDVTELRVAEAALRSANADLKQFKALVEASPDFIAIAGLDGKVKYVNPGGRLLIGMDPAVDVTTTTIPDYLTPQGLHASLNIERPAVMSRGHWEGESTLRNYAGPPIPVAIASFLIRDSETGEPFALATVQRDMTERLAAETALRELADQRQALLTRLVDAQDEERARIAADVHDDPVQALAAVDLRLGLLRRRIDEYAPELAAVIEPLQTSVAGASDRLRALLFNLEPPDLRDGLAGALASAAKEIFESTQTRWTVNGDHEPDVPDATRAIAYLISKEALNNARRHASAQNVSVTIGTREGGLEVIVADDGVGVGQDPPEASPGHRGVVTMQDRAAVAGGRCTIRDAERGGTVVTVWLPQPLSLRSPE